MTDSEERFSDRDVDRIIQKALEMQRRGRKTEPNSNANRDNRLSLGDIEQAAKEVGIEPSFIREAANEIEAESQLRKGSLFLGGNPTVIAIETIDAQTGGELIAELAAAMQSIVGNQGSATTHGATLSWSTDRLAAMQQAYSTEISVRGTKDRTKVEVRKDLGPLAWAIFGGVMGGVGLGAGLGVGLGVGLGALGMPGVAGIIAMGTLGLSYLLSRSIFKTVHAKRQRDTRKILSRIRAFLLADSDYERS